MKKIFCLIAFIISIGIQSDAQLIFQKTFSAPGNQNAIAAMQSASDDYYILSETDSGQNNSKDFLLLKLDVSGNLIWSKYFGTTADDIPTDVKEMSNGKIMLCGYTYLNGSANSDILLINIDTAGTVMWSKTFGGIQNDYGNKIAARSDSSVVVAGQTYSYGISISSGYAIKINSVGNIDWSVTYSIASTPNTTFLSIDNTFDGGFILAGYEYSGNISTASVIKIDAFGSVVTTGSIGIQSWYSMGYDIKAVPGGDFMVVGKAYSTTDSGSVFVARLSPQALIPSFLKIFSTADFEIAKSVVVTPDANFAFAGSALFNNTFNLLPKGFLTKINLTGNVIYNKNYKPAGTDSYFNSIIVTHDNNLLMTGKVTSTVNSSADIYFVKAQLNDGASGCNENTFSYLTNAPNFSVGFNPHVNFGGIAASLTISDSSANILQNDLCTGVGYQELNNDVSVKLVYPNPSFGNLTILFNDNLSEKSIRIFDVRGNIIYEKEKIKNAEQEINLTTQSKGIYFLKVIDKDKTSVNKIVLK